MTKPKNKSDPNAYVDSSPQSVLERELISEYLRGKGYRREDLRKLPREEAKRLMKEACQYASLRLTDIEAKAGFRRRIKYDSP